VKPATAAALVVALLSLWVMRKSWRIPWERPASINVCCQAFKILVTVPAWDYTVSSKLHTATGVWNLEELIGHIGYFVGMFAVLFLVVSRLDMTERQFKSYVRYRIELPGVLIISFLVIVFVTGLGRHYIPDTVQAQTTEWLRVYWHIVAIALTFILFQITRALLILRGDPRSRKAANAYLAAVVTSAACLVAFQLEIPVLQWVMIRVEVVAYAIAASYTWHCKQRVGVPSDYLLPG
jgi:hypothetical protein